MTATLRLRCDGDRAGGACPATFTADLSHDLSGLRCEAADYGWAWRGVPGARRDLCPTCSTPAPHPATTAEVTAWSDRMARQLRAGLDRLAATQETTP